MLLYRAPAESLGVKLAILLFFGFSAVKPHRANRRATYNELNLTYLLESKLGPHLRQP